MATDLVYFTEILGGRVVFAVEAMGTRVAAVQFTTGPPLVLLADHLEGERPILVYRVADLGAALAGLEGRGWQRQRALEIPQGPCMQGITSFRLRVSEKEGLDRPGQQALAEGGHMAFELSRLSREQPSSWC